MTNRFKNLSKGDHTTTVKSNRTGFVPLESIFNNDDENEEDKICRFTSDYFWQTFSKIRRSTIEIIIPAMRDKIMNPSSENKDVPISVKYKDEIITVTGNVVVIDDRKTDYFLCIGMPWIQKVKEIPDINKHEFQMTVRSKFYVIPTFTKPTEDISMDQPSSKISSCCTSVIQDTTQDTETSEPLEEE
ncbi:5712_t:CDS:2 [Diversispora eburnea]|uniref:5712_t:CDS:1 n=1 Tax=Diversispora eburnea TaxID=1213867 RepID=A0A9N8VXZ4_9GLOM|nr:5712_t:CDS:2 [Diversispora eburnea]